jgi:glycosidase
VSQYLVGAGTTWINHGVDDLRLDAITFVFPDFVSTFTHAMIDHLKELGRPDPHIVGEWSHDGVGDQKSIRFADHYDYFKTNVLDFQLSFALNRFIGGKYEDMSQQTTATQLDQLLHQRVKAFKGRDDWQGTFIDNHGEIRTMTRLDKIGVPTETERRQRMDLATVLLLTVRGIPIIYYGDEQYLALYDAPVDYQKQYINSGSDDPHCIAAASRLARTPIEAEMARSRRKEQTPGVEGFVDTLWPLSSAWLWPSHSTRRHRLASKKKSGQ